MDQTGVQQFFAPFSNDSFLFTVSVLWKTAVIWVPLFLMVIFWELWMRYIQRKFIASREYVLLEIKLPGEVTKSPLAMETVLNGLHFGPGESDWVKKYIQGQVRPQWSLEIVSLEGNIHFFISARKDFKNLIESQFYSQYPDIELNEVDDYAKMVQFEVGKTAVWGCDFDLTKNDAYPIRTYVDYGLDEDPKEEHKIDPIAPMLEFLATVGKGEQIWYQIIIRQAKEDRKKPGTFFSRSTWKKEAEAEIEKIKKDATPIIDGSPGFPNITPLQQEAMKAIEKSIRKHGFECGIRGVYFAESGAFKGANIPPFINSFKQYSSNSLNGFKPTRWLIPFDFPWQDFQERRKNARRRNLLDAYRRRSWFHSPYKTPSFVLNTEELATIYHFPGSVVQTPTLQRVTSKRGEAPSNLPR